jgi:hypothetical protein
MTKVVLKTTALSDPFHRILGLWVDNVPPVGWTENLELQGTAALKWFVQDGDTVNGDLNLSDGKHDIFVAISQADASKLGAWCIDGSFDNVEADVCNIDVDTVGKFIITVENGIVTSTKDEGMREVDDLNNGTFQKLKSIIVTNSTKVKNVVKENQKASAIIGGASIAATAVAIFVSSRSNRF